MILKKTGKKITIRPLEISDYRHWKAAHLSIKVIQKNKWDHPPKKASELTLKNFKNLLKRQKINRDNDEFYDFGVFLKDGTLVGNVSLMDISRNVFQNAYVGYRIFNNHWRNGYGKEALGLVIAIAFKTLKLHRVEAGIDPMNKGSLALAKSLKMRREGLSLKRIFLDGKWNDLLLYVLTCEDLGMKWKPVKEKLNSRN